MKIESLERANEIQERINKLDQVRRWLKDGKRNVYLLGQGCSISECIRLSEDARAVLLGVCIGENERLKKEFESL